MSRPTVDETLQLIKQKAIDFARTHATENAKTYYVLGKRDAATTILHMIREDGLTALVDVANEILRYDPEHADAQWLVDNHLTLLGEPDKLRE